MILHPTLASKLTLLDPDRFHHQHRVEHLDAQLCAARRENGRTTSLEAKPVPPVPAMIKIVNAAATDLASLD